MSDSDRDSDLDSASKAPMPKPLPYCRACGSHGWRALLTDSDPERRVGVYRCRDCGEIGVCVDPQKRAWSEYHGAFDTA
jgi:hypothetical protein